MNTILYKLTFPNGKLYIGQTTDFAKRMRDHAKDSKYKKSAIAHAIVKHGFNGVQKEILCIGSAPYILDLEIKAIAAFGTLVPNGYNICKGGVQSPMLNPIVAAKVSAALKGKKKTAAHKAKMPLWKKGHQPTAETRAKMSEAQKRRKPRSKEECMAISARQLGRKRSAETCRRISEGKKNPSAETRLRISLSKKGVKMKTSSPLIGRKWMHKDGVGTYVIQQDIEMFLHQGWALGMPPKKPSKGVI